MSTCIEVFLISSLKDNLITTQITHHCVGNHLLINDDCLKVLKLFPSESVGVVITSPPYNIGLNYGEYKDSKNDDEYISWCIEWAQEINRVLKKDGSFFLNIAGSVSNFSLPIRLSDRLLGLFCLQNQIIWVKSIYIPEAVHYESLKLPSIKPGHSFGHFKPINSNRFLNNTHEFIFHFTKTSNVEIDKLSVGVPYMHPSNLSRWKTKKETRCGGNVWYIPYETKNVKDKHPAMFPLALPQKCMKLHGSLKKEIVLDVFGGTGTTSCAADSLGLESVSIELDADYHSMSVKRLDSFVLSAKDQKYKPHTGRLTHIEEI